MKLSSLIKSAKSVTLFTLICIFSINLIGCEPEESELMEENTCQAYPSCGSEQVEVEECGDDDSCVVAEMCGYEIFCVNASEAGAGSEIDDNELIITCQAYPTCGSDQVEVEECGDNESCVIAEECGYEIFCVDAP